MRSRYLLVTLLALLVVAASTFALTASPSAATRPVAWDETIKMGLTDVDARLARTEGYAIPRAEVFYSQYRYVVGYYGVTSLVDELHRDAHDRQFGRPLSIYVTDFSTDGVSLTDDGFLRTPEGTSATNDWVRAEEAFFVVGSRARTPSGPALVPFADRADARRFVTEYGGTVHRWDAVAAMTFGSATATSDRMRAAVDERARWADAATADARRLLERPVSVVVGDDGTGNATSLQDAVSTAPNGTTVLLPAGTYRVDNLTVDRPITLRGVGPATRLVGPGNGTILQVRARRVAIADVRLAGIGNTTSVSELPSAANDTWDYRVKLGYGYGDAGVTLDGANGSLVHGVSMDTPANGVLVRDSDRVVVEDIAVNGSTEWIDGFMGVMVMHSRVVVQDSTFVGGRDGVYTHVADGLVVRNNSMTAMRFGVHEMYTSDALVANNTVRETAIGVVVMTRPRGNALVENDVRRSKTGIFAAGSLSYVAGNVLAANDVGLTVPARRSLFEHNVIVGNDVGARANTLIPSNRVEGNDFVDNDRYVIAVIGPLRVWSGPAGGNFWSDAPGADTDGDGILDRPFVPTGTVDGRVNRVAGARTLSRSPAMAALGAVVDAVPGLRRTGVVDAAPLDAPTRPAVVERVHNETREGRT